MDYIELFEKAVRKDIEVREAIAGNIQLAEEFNLIETADYCIEAARELCRGEAELTDYKARAKGLDNAFKEFLQKVGSPS